MSDTYHSLHYHIVFSTKYRAHHPDFASHLRGRIAWLTQLNPERGTKLRRLFESLPPSKFP